MRPVFLLILVLPLAGCLSGGWLNVVPAFCPDEAPEAPEGSVAAPLWKRGDEWAYTIRNETGEEVGYARYEVRGCVRVNDVTAYRVQETYLKLGVFGDYLDDAPRERTIYLDVATLNQVWDVCGEGGVMGDCNGRHREWDFPLQDGKAWQDWCCGDALIQQNLTAEALPDRQWRLTLHEEGHTAPSTEWTYDPAAGRFTEKTEWRMGHPDNPPEGFDRWVLDT